MKTVKQCLKEANREELINDMSFNYISDPMNLWDRRQQSLEKLRDEYSECMNSFVDVLLSLEEEKSDANVVYLIKSTLGNNHRDLTLEMCVLDEIREDIDAPCYSLEFSEWECTLGFLVADTKLTQDNLNTLLRLYLKGSSFLGMTATDYQQNIERIRSRIEEAEKDIIEGNSISAEEMFDSLYRSLGRPIPEKDPEEIRLRKRILEVQYEHEQYCRRRERNRILQGCGEGSEGKRKPTDSDFDYGDVIIEPGMFACVK